MFGCPLTTNAELRLLEPWHDEELHACVEATREDLAPWTFVADRVRTPSDARRLLDDYARHHARDTGHYTGIWHQGRLVGVAMLRAFDTGSATAELGAWIVPALRGQGLVTRALERLMDWAIHERGIRRVQLQTSPANPRGAALAQRLGMTHEGTLRGSVVVSGTRHDSDIWAVLVQE